MSVAMATVRDAEWRGSLSERSARRRSVAALAGFITGKASCHLFRKTTERYFKVLEVTFSCASFPSFFAFKEDMLETHISALLSSPTVSDRFLPRGPATWLQCNV
jgi:hypothetical protein